MAEFCNTTLVYCNTTLAHDGRVNRFESGVLLNGTFWNGSIFNGPGLMQFECEPCEGSCPFIHSDAGIIGITTWVLGLLGLILIVTVTARQSGKKKVLEAIADCKNDQERIEYVSRMLQNVQSEKSEFTRWPGEH